MTCLNCGNEFEGRFCNECGQKASVKTITIKSIFSEAFRIITNTDRGLFYNFINLTIRPKTVVADYISGKRKPFFAPVQYAILGVTMLTLLDHYYGTGVKVLGDAARDIEMMTDTSPYKIGMGFGKVLKSNLKFALLLNIFFFAVPARLFNRRYNFAEHLAIQAIILGHAAFVTIIFFPVVHLTILANPVFYIAVFLMNFFIFYRKKEIFEGLLGAFFTVVLGMALFLLIPMLFYFLFIT
ncbi:MAG: DUF3667 domain-containing protein [Bacteroidetes bacterium]|nr:MAG: DUF3667 domain-containing protein [Bacteroidota bacterium]